MLLFRSFVLFAVTQTVKAKYHQCAPDKGKGNRFVAGKRFAINKNSEQEHQARAYVLEEAEC